LSVATVSVPGVCSRCWIPDLLQLDAEALDVDPEPPLPPELPHAARLPITTATPAAAMNRRILPHPKPHTAATRVNSYQLRRIF
jgi:hypothetical protein